jgi:hypothetical protein
MKDIKFNKTQDEFGKTVLKVIKQVYPYVKHRLYVAETKGIVPRNMYSPSGIIDDAIIKLYENGKDKYATENEIRFALFAITDTLLKQVFKTEAVHKQTMSTRDILNNELKQLEEKFTVDGDFDLIMEEELDDISYHQKDFVKKEFLYEDAQKELVNSLDISKDVKILTDKQRKALNSIYHWLPEETSNILDMFVFGKLTYKEIAIVKEADEHDIKKIIQGVSTLIRKNIE